MQTYEGEHTGRAKIMLSYTWGYTFGAIGGALMAFCAKHGLDPRTTHVDLLHVHQPAPSRRWPGRREPRMLRNGGESSASHAQARR